MPILESVCSRQMIDMSGSLAAILLYLAGVPARANQVVPFLRVPPPKQTIVEESNGEGPSLPFSGFESRQHVSTLRLSPILEDRASVFTPEAGHALRSSQPSRKPEPHPLQLLVTNAGDTHFLETEIDCPTCAFTVVGPTNSIDLLAPITTGGSSSFPFARLVRTNPVGQAPVPKVRWRSLFEDSLRYLTVMHSFRLATEAGTREGLRHSLLGGYFKALGAMHGWSDGDGYYENYLGHPIEGAVSAYIWTKNDPRYRNVEFGKNPNYWKSRLRAYAFSWAFSAQFEIGPISEASIGQIQRYCCQYGFVDHVITPNGGLVWVIGGDILDKYVVRRIEDHTHNRNLRILTRLALNPAETFANLMVFQYPWNRENRDAPSHYSGSLRRSPVSAEQQIGRFEPSIVPTFEIAATLPSLLQVGDLSCLGGGGVAGMRLTDVWQWTLEVSGCTLENSLPRNWSGDSLTFTTGPQWIRHTASRWTPHAHLRVGGQKITEEVTDPVRRKRIESELPPGRDLQPFHDQFHQHYESTGLSLSVGGGLDFRVYPAIALRVASLDYVRSWLNEVNQTNFNRGLRFTTGVVFRLGTW